jgi:hypothetical protein
LAGENGDRAAVSDGHRRSDPWPVSAVAASLLPVASHEGHTEPGKVMRPIL